MIEIIASYAAIWAPSLVAVLGVVTTVVTAISKSKAAINELKQDTTFKDLSTQLKNALQQNEELKQQNDIIIDELTKIKNYREQMNDK